MAHFELLSILICIFWTIVPTAKTASLEQLKYFINQNRYAMQAITFQAALSMDNVISSSMDMALHACQQSFKSERWNCPARDFFRRHTTKEYQIDREDAFVAAISATAIIYTIAKECSSGVYSGCGCRNAASVMSHCSDEPEQASQLYVKFTQQKFGDDFCSRMEEHNYKAITTLLRQSVLRQCVCTVSGCSEDNCINVLKPFNEIAKDIKAMYDEGLQIVNAVNTQVMWSNVPLDSLIYARDSPNFCDLDAVSHWSGMLGRQCTREIDGNGIQTGSCEHLCHQCGYEVRAENVVVERSCNCRFTWNFKVICERCMEVKQQFYCY